MHPTDHPSGEATPELPPDFGRHNMFAFGRTTLFLSHFPSFMAPHDTQLVFEATLEDANGSLQEVWLRERAEPPRPGRIRHEARSVRAVDPVHPGSAGTRLVYGDVLSRWRRSLSPS